MLHGCRQLVTWVAPLIRVTSVTLILCYMCHRRQPPTKSGGLGNSKHEIRNPKKFRILRFEFRIYQTCGFGRGRKVRMTPSQHGPLIPWATQALQWPIQWVAKPQGGANPIKVGPSSDWGLQFDLMKLESLVIADQPRRGEYVLKLCTHRLSRQRSREHPTFESDST